MDSLGKNTGKKESEVPQLRLTLWPPWTIDYQAPLLIGFSRQEHWSRLPFPSPGDFPEPGLNPDFLNCRQMLYHLSHPGKAVAISSSRGSSWPRNWTHVSCVSWIGWQILYYYITWDAPPRQMGYYNKFIILSPRFKKSWGGGAFSWPLHSPLVLSHLASTHQQGLVALLPVCPESPPFSAFQLCQAHLQSSKRDSQTYI